MICYRYEEWEKVPKPAEGRGRSVQLYLFLHWHSVGMGKVLGTNTTCKTTCTTIVSQEAKKKKN